MITVTKRTARLAARYSVGLMIEDAPDIKLTRTITVRPIAVSLTWHALPVSAPPSVHITGHRKLRNGDYGATTQHRYYGVNMPEWLATLVRENEPDWSQLPDWDQFDAG